VRGLLEKEHNQKKPVAGSDVFDDLTVSFDGGDAGRLLLPGLTCPNRFPKFEGPSGVKPPQGGQHQFRENYFKPSSFRNPRVADVPEGRGTPRPVPIQKELNPACPELCASPGPI